MPRYDYECRKGCGVMELIHRMSDTIERCPLCKSREFGKIFLEMPASKIFGSGWENENGGRGRFIDYIAKQGTTKSGLAYDTKDPNAYCRSPQEAIEKGKKMGLKLKLVK